MDLTLSELSEVFSCLPEEGALFWLPRSRDRFNNDFSYKMWNCQYSGKKAGGRDVSGYLIVNINGTRQPVHRAVWIFANGSIPEVLFIDHINHVRDDNRIENLRLVTHHQNMKNQAMHSSNISGINGVRFDKKARKWIATVGHRDSAINLGRFDSIEEAKKARDDANIRFNYHENHGVDKYLHTPYIDPWLRVD